MMSLKRVFGDAFPFVCAITRFLLWWPEWHHSLSQFGCDFEMILAWSLFIGLALYTRACKRMWASQEPCEGPEANKGWVDLG